MMRSSPAPRTSVIDTAIALGLTLPGVEAATKYDGTPVLRIGGAFMAGLAMHPSAQANTLVVRVAPDDRDSLVSEAPEAYYLTEYYRPHPVVLVRLSCIGRDALHDLLAVSRRLTLPKGRPRAAQRRSS